ncbi:MAG TPA: putrescine ABC transporter permease PotI, partial [Trinickia sp.]|nr:putrescine ABC transporter permease PotI [Trinickia sp.]
DLGATPLKVFFVITLPLISQAILSGWLLSFTLSVDDLVLSAFLSGPGSTTLPLVVFSRVRLGLNPEMNALATIFITLVTIGVILVNQMMLAKERKRTRDMQMAFAAIEPDDPKTPRIPQTASPRKTPEPLGTA